MRTIYNPKYWKTAYEIDNSLKAVYDPDRDLWCVPDAEEDTKDIEIIPTQFYEFRFGADIVIEKDKEWMKTRRKEPPQLS